MLYVHYEGWDNYYNEYIKADRVRAPNAKFDSKTAHFQPAPYSSNLDSIPRFSLPMASANIYKSVIDIRPDLVP